MLSIIKKILHEIGDFVLLNNIKLRENNSFKDQKHIVNNAVKKLILIISSKYKKTPIKHKATLVLYIYFMNLSFIKNRIFHCLFFWILAWILFKII